MKDGRIIVMFLVNALWVGGAEQQLLELVKGIDKNRFEPIVVSLYPGGTLEAEVKAISGVEFISLDRRGKYDFFILLKVLRLLRQRHVDVIQPFLTPATFFGLVPAVISRTPVKVVTERCGVRVKTHFGYDTYRKTEDFFSRFADWVIPNSEAGRSYLIGRGINPARIQVVYNGINLDRLTPDPFKVTQIRDAMGLPPEGSVVGITASLSPAKDHVTFLQAARLVSQVMPNTRFAIVGDGPLRKSLENEANELGLAAHVTFHGIQRDIGSYISSHDVACLCSIDHEGCSNALLEAMALGKPVVATDVGGNRELVDHGRTGLLIPMRNPQSLAGAILTYLRQPDWARTVGQRARQMVLIRFGLDRMVREYEQLYEQSIRAKRGDLLSEA
jgi:glycosyltransferase involved in cell wall biosynthesis